MERLGGLGVHTLEELQTFTSRVTTAQRRKRHLAEELPHAPGVYLFRDERGRVLYVGTSRDLRTRVRTYFTASETRSRMGEMVGLASRVEGIECATPLEAEVRELRLIAEHKPRYNRRSRFPERVHWVKLTREPWPRLSLVRRVLDDDADYLGPFSLAEDRREVPGRAARDLPGPAVHRPARHGRRRAAPCVLAEMGRCLSPCDGSVDADDVRRASCDRLRDTLLRRPDEVVERDQPADGRRWPPTSGSRRPASTATGWRRSCGPPPAPSGSARSPAAPRSWPPGARTTAAGRSTSSATAGWPRPA